MYNNPYFYQSVARPSLISRLFGGGGTAAAARGVSRLNWGTILSNTQKSLGIINQAIPIVYQVKPMIDNAKTMFKIAGAVKDSDSSNFSNSYKSSAQNNEVSNNYTNNKPIFYI